MYIHDGFSIGDAWYFVDGTEVHMFYLSQSERERSARGYSMHIGHAVSEDLVHWEYVGVALSALKESRWESKGLATGSVVTFMNRLAAVSSAKRCQF